MTFGLYDEEPGCETPADEEASFMLVYLDSAGRVQHAVMRCSVRPCEVRSKARQYRAAFEAYCTTLGATLVSLQVTYERTQGLMGMRPRLKLVA